MATGWGSCDGVQDTIDSTINDAIDWVRLEMQTTKFDLENETCIDCDKVIPQPRRIAIPGTLYCVNCQSNHDKKHETYYNRRGSKDSQLR